MASDNQTVNVKKELAAVQELASWDLERAVNTAKQLAGELHATSDRGLDTQIYKFLSSVRKIEMAIERAGTDGEREAVIATTIPMLRPRLAYAASRKKELYVVYEVLNQLLPKVKKVADFKRLLQFVEAVVAYQKFNQEFSGQSSQPQGGR